MTVRIRIPSSEEDPEKVPAAGYRSSPRTPALIVAILLAGAILVAGVNSVTSSEDPPQSSLSAPVEFEDSTMPTLVPSLAGPWSERLLPGSGEIIAMGPVGGTSIAVVAHSASPGADVWERRDRAWTLVGSPALEAVEAAVVMDDRVLFVGDLEGRPTVWEWVDGSARYLFQPTSGSVVGVWSVGGRSVVAVLPDRTVDGPGTDSTARDALWIESSAAEFEEIELVGIETVLTVGGDAGATAIGGRNAEGRAAVGFVEGDRVSATQLPFTPDKSSVVDLAGDSTSLMALVSVADRPLSIGDEIRSAAIGWGRVAETPDLIGIEVIGGLVMGVDHVGALVVHDLNGGELPSPSTPQWDIGSIRGFDLLGDDPVIYGQSDVFPVYVGPGAAATEVDMPAGMWTPYHSEASDGFELVHVGSREFAVRGGRLFHRATDGESWQPSVGNLAVYGTPTIVETMSGFVLVPSARGGLWTSDDGRVWNRLEDSDDVRIEQVATDGDVVVGLTPIGGRDGGVTDVTVIDSDGGLARRSLPMRLVGLGWEPGVGFFASQAPPGSGHATSSDGMNWLVEESDEPFDRVVGFAGALHRSSGVGIGSRSASFPTAVGRLYIYDGGTRTWVDRSGTTWIHDGSDWQEIHLGVIDGLPRRPRRLVVVGPRVFAMTDSVDGRAETYLLEPD